MITIEEYKKCCEDSGVEFKEKWWEYSDKNLPAHIIKAYFNFSKEFGTTYYIPQNGAVSIGMMIINKTHNGVSFLFRNDDIIEILSEQHFQYDDPNLIEKIKNLLG